ncbi:D-alanyl-D-alanine carboxypeptidase/D-alanyl-D-alanine-endopeptidase [Deinococcus koreensis]|uniref:D-alanyl-D-alanine carboxypeptidase n=1 Tax=Deinococcus koreensis TaxID=2054903 RepID=A0A2K3UUK3_9DEIO|nr:D-alanyl-D-alanine carboxypeptidase [Deinococcus koreensis]PNY80212.1 D-alanyl-D-alanine carboxypeptidase [Deinococcus koreensis]
MRRALALLLLLPAVSGAQPALAPAPPSSLTLHRDPALSPGLRAALKPLPPGVQVGLLAVDLRGGAVLESLSPDRPLIPASVTKLVTGAAILAERGGADGWWSAELTVPAAQAGRPQVRALTLRGSGDPTLSVSGGTYSLRALARQAHARGLREVGQVRLDTAALDSGSWRGAVIGVPMTALRLSDWHDAPPASADEAHARLGRALIAELRLGGIRVRSDVVGSATPHAPYVAPVRMDERGTPLPPDPLVPPSRRPEQGVASVRSASPQDVLAETERPSDNLRAEELLATLARRPAGTGRGTLAGALAEERALLERLGVDLSGVRLADGSGLSRHNRQTPRAITGLLRAMYDLPYPLAGPAAALPAGPPLPEGLYRARRNAFVEALPQAGTGEDVPRHNGRGGTLAQRLLGSGLDVRAKTGTLPGVSALAGYVTARSGRVVAFAILMNGPESTPILTLRAVQDESVRALAAAH